MIRFLHRKEIDDARWNQVIESSGFETVYAHTWYLDVCAAHWGGLIMPDYEYVMPVAFRKKLGLTYIYQPRFCQQLGVHSAKQVDHAISEMFLQALGKNFRFGDYAFNEGNHLEKQKGFQVIDNTNYTLQLASPYEEMKRGYSENCRRNVRKAHQSGLKFSDEISIRELVLLKKKHDHAKQPDAHYEMLIKMFSDIEESGRVRAYGVKLREQISAGAIFAFSKKRVHYLLSVSTSEGKDKRGMFLVIDQLIQLNSGKPLHLDFEGSNMPSVARFFSGFGAQPQLYQRISFDNLSGKLIRRVKNGR